MSSTNSDTLSNFFQKYTIEKTEDLLANLTEPHPNLILPSIEQIRLSETKYESYTETFYYWVNSTLTIENLGILYTYLEDQEFHWEPATEEDHEDEWTARATQQSRRKWFRCYG